MKNYNLHIFTFLIFLILGNSLSAQACDMDQVWGEYLNFERTDDNLLIEISTSCANENNVDAQVILAETYYLNKDYTDAFKWLKNPIDKKNSSALYIAAIMYEEGYHVEKNLKTALELYHQAADKGDVDAQFQLGFLYGTAGWAESFTLKRDYKESLKWLKKAVEQDHPQAAFNIYVIYSNGWLNGDEDYWLKLAAELGHEEATTIYQKTSKKKELEKTISDILDEIR